MKSPRITGPLFSETAKGSISGVGTFRNVGGKVFLEQKRRGPELPPEAGAEMRALFAEAWNDYLALPPSKPRNVQGKLVYRQPTWGKFWQEWLKIYRLGGVFTGGTEKTLPYISLTATGRIARTGDALLVLNAPMLSSAGGFDAGEVAIVSAAIGWIELECTDDPYFIPRINRAKTNRQIDDITATAAVESRLLAVMRADVDAIGIYSLVVNPYDDARVSVQLDAVGISSHVNNTHVGARVSVQLEGVGSDGLVQVPYEDARVNVGIDNISGELMGEVT